MPRDPAYLADMIAAARLAVSYTAGRSELDFLDDRQLQDAVIRRLEIIGEAARRVSDQTRGQLPDVPWGMIIGMRNLLIHRYDAVDPAIVWETVHVNLPPLIERLERFIARL